MPATGSGFANMCLDHMVLPDSDLVVVEFATNDFLRVSRTHFLRLLTHVACESTCLTDMGFPATLTATMNSIKKTNLVAGT
jgi:hypothetical protein